MPNLVERTALAPFNMNGRAFRAGQVVAVDPVQLRKLVAARCVAASEDEDALVPKADLPPTQYLAADYQAEVDTASTDAASKIALIRQEVDTARTEADRQLEELRLSGETSRADADRAIAEHAARVDDARRAADEEIATIQRETEARKAALAAEGASGSGDGTGDEPGSDTSRSRKR